MVGRPCGRLRPAVRAWTSGSSGTGQLWPLCARSIWFHLRQGWDLPAASGPAVRVVRTGRRARHRSGPDRPTREDVTRCSARSLPKPISPPSRPMGWPVGASTVSSSARSSCGPAPSPGSSTRAPRRPTAGPDSTTSGPGSTRTCSAATGPCGATRCPARPGGTPTGSPSRSRSRSSWASPTKRQIEEGWASPSSPGSAAQSVRNYVDEWKILTDRIGYWIDSDSAYWTFAPEYVESVWWNLKNLWDQGLLYEDIKVVPDCPRCGTACPATSWASPTSTATSSTSRPTCCSRSSTRGRPPPGSGRRSGRDTLAGLSLVAWTTTPWTLLSNTGAAVGPDLEYAVVGDCHRGRRSGGGGLR